MVHTFGILEHISLPMSLGMITAEASHLCMPCQDVSSVGKKTAWEVWKSLPEITEVFIRLSTTPDEVREADLKELERYVVLLYSRTSQLTDVNEARKHLFSYCNRKLENIPPSQ